MTIFGKFDSGIRVKGPELSSDVTFERIGPQLYRGAFFIGATSSMISLMDDFK